MAFASMASSATPSRRCRVERHTNSQCREYAVASMAWRRKNTERPRRWRIEHTHEYTSQKQHRKNTGGRPAAGTLLPQQIFVRDYLGPRLEKDHPSLLLFVFDHNRDHLVAWGDTVYGDKDASKYVDGLAFHWYAGGLNRDLDGAVAHYAVDSCV